MSERAQLNRGAAGAVIVILAMVVLAADQFTKHLVLTDLTPEATVPVLGDFLQFRLVMNPGAAFSLGSGVTWLFTIALAVVAVVIAVLAFTKVRSRLWVVVLGALLGGVSGNLTDRLTREPGFAIGHVVDFIYTPWMLPAIYNVADIFIVTSMISVALLVLIGLRLDGSREREASSAPPDGDAIVVGELDEDDRYLSRAERRAQRAAEAVESND